MPRISTDALIGKWMRQRRSDGGDAGVVTCVHMLDTQLSCDGNLVTFDGAKLTLHNNSNSNSTNLTQGSYNGEKIITWFDGINWVKQGKLNNIYHN